jgi:curved DNA-binding protein CbpA
MGTLYELLGALPDDDSEELRAAFRKAAKASHPDINPDDPDASSRFRQIVRAHEILSEPEQRATYDLLLALALKEPDTNSTNPTVYATIHKYASNTLAATIMAAMLVAGYALFGTVSRAPAFPDKVTEMAASEPVEIAAAAPAEQSDATDRNEPHDKPETPAITDGVVLASAVEPAGAAPAAATPAEPAPKPAMNDARTYRERGMFAYRDGDLYSALADFDMAIERDPRFAGAYVNRGIIWYRMREFNRAFADLAQAKRIKNASRARISAAAPRKGSPVRTHDAPKNFDRRSLLEARGSANGP